MKPKLSVVIPAFNEEDYITGTLKSLERQSLRSFEVIVVANGCTDRTADIARSFSATTIELSESNTSKARNKGAEAASTDRLVFLDADTRLSDNVLEEIFVFFENHGKDFIGTCLIEPEFPHLKARFLSSAKNALHRVGLPWGGSGIIFCHRELFNRVRFNERMRFREDGNFVRSALHYAKYQCLTSCFVTPSLRKMEQQGYVKYAVRWMKNWVSASVNAPLRRKP